MKETLPTIYKSIKRQLLSKNQIEPIKVADGYSLDTLFKVMVEIYTHDKQDLANNPFFLSNYAEFLSFIMTTERIKKKNSKQKEAYQMPYRDIVKLLDSKPAI